MLSKMFKNIQVCSNNLWPKTLCGTWTFFEFVTVFYFIKLKINKPAGDTFPKCFSGWVRSRYHLINIYVYISTKVERERKMWDVWDFYMRLSINGWKTTEKTTESITILTIMFSCEYFAPVQSDMERRVIEKRARLCMGLYECWRNARTWWIKQIDT